MIICKAPIFGALLLLALMEELISKDVKLNSVLLILIVGVLIPVVGLYAPFALASWENNVEVSDRGISVNMIGGVDIPWEIVKSVELTSELPKSTAVNGTLGDAMKGDFVAIADSSALKLIINGDAPYVKIQTEDFNVYLNQHYQKETKKVFQEIQTAFKASKS